MYRAFERVNFPESFAFLKEMEATEGLQLKMSDLIIFKKLHSASLCITRIKKYIVWEKVGGRRSHGQNFTVLYVQGQKTRLLQIHTGVMAACDY